MDDTEIALNLVSVPWSVEARLLKEVCEARGGMSILPDRKKLPKISLQTHLVGIIVIVVLLFLTFSVVLLFIWLRIFVLIRFIV